MVLDILLIVLLVMIVMLLLPHIIVKWVAFISTMKWASKGKEEEPKERYFLYDLKEKKWVETKKDPTGGENE